MAIPDLTIRAFEPDQDLDWATDFLDAELGGRLQARRGELVDVLEGQGLVALLADRDEAGGARPIGLVTWLGGAGDPIDRAEAEVRALVVSPPERGRGVARQLVDAAAAALQEAGVRRAWLVTTNDNLAALALYQKAGWRLATLRPGGVDQSRRTVKPAIPEIGEHGIPLRDELELTLDLGETTG